MKEIQFNLFELPEDTIKKSNRTWKDDTSDWWELCKWKPEIGIPCLISTVIGFCIENNREEYCCLDTGIITDIDSNKSITVQINPFNKDYFKSGLHFKVDYYFVNPELTGKYDNL